MSCSKNTVDSYQSDNEIDFNGSMGNKYKHLYNSLYVNIALKRDLKKEALRVFVDNITSLNDIKLYEKISKISLDLYDYKRSELIAERWLMISPDS